eukprot:gene52598-59928_t
MLHNLDFATDDGDPINIFVDHPAGARATKQLCTAVCSDKPTLDTYRADAIARLTSGRQIQEPAENVLLQQLRTTTDALPDGRTKISLTSHMAYQHGSAPHGPGSSAEDRQAWTKKQKWAEVQVRNHLATLGLSDLEWHRGKHKGAGHKA